MIRELDKLGEPLATGRTADIYCWSDTEVVKLFQPWMSRDAIERERSNTQIAKDMGLPVPSVGNILMVDGRSGLLLERISGFTMMSRLDLDISQVESSAKMLAEIHISLNSVVADARLPAQRESVYDKIASCQALSLTNREAVLSALSRMPSGDHLCHGDFHPHNVIRNQRQHFIIDWIDASHGNPMADLARSSLLFLERIATSSCSAEERRAVIHFHRTYLDGYLQSASADRGEYAHWLPIMAAARLSEGIVKSEDWLVTQVYEGLSLDSS